MDDSSTHIENNLRLEIRSQFIGKMRDKMIAGEKIDKRVIRKIAGNLQINDLDYAYELTELTWTIHYRLLISHSDDISTNLNRVIDFYRHGQPTFSQTSSTKKIYQQYSTAAPIALLAGWFCNAHKVDTVFEPSAGNGLLTIYAPYENTIVNELDKTRLENLQSQPFWEVRNQDALLPFKDLATTFDAVLSNPPFGKLEAVNYNYNGFKIKKLDHLMIAHALATMKDDGRAALIIGGWNGYDKNGRFSPHREFFNWLYRHYNVVDIINIESKKLYAKQGTGFPLRMILIAGRKEEPFGAAPLEETAPDLATVVDSFEELFERVQEAKEVAVTNIPTLNELMAVELEKLNFELGS